MRRIFIPSEDRVQACKCLAVTNIDYSMLLASVLLLLLYLLLLLLRVQLLADHEKQVPKALHQVVPV